VVFFGNTVTNHVLTAKTQSSQRRWFFALAVRGRQSKTLRLFEARALSRPLPEAERLSFIRPPLTAGYKRTSNLGVLGASAVKYVTAFMKCHTKPFPNADTAGRDFASKVRSLALSLICQCGKVARDLGGRRSRY
jgi:hypothetical protein